MLKVVSNTTPIISLLKINRLELLKELYGQIYIPHAVFEEIEAGKFKSFYRNLSALSWIQIMYVKSKHAPNFFPVLDAGEAEAILLASEMNTDLIIIDERLGRLYAKYVNLKTTGTLGILLKAKEKGLIGSIKPMIEKLQENDFYMSKSLVRQILKLANEI